MGVSFETFETDGGGLRVRGGDGIRPADVETQPYPGFATDLQAPLAVLMTQADGVSSIHETIYEDRLDYTMELVKMGAVIEVLDERHARIAGPTPLHGREVEIADLRAGATLILAALAAQDTSIISGVEHVDRGYEAIESKLVGARRADHPHRRIGATCRRSIGSPQSWRRPEPAARWSWCRATWRPHLAA